jgi:hypothetical protein
MLNPMDNPFVNLLFLSVAWGLVALAVIGVISWLF